MKRAKSIVETRRSKVLELLIIEPEITADAMAERLAVSPLTIRRDLQYWEEKNRITRYYGGARVIQNYLESSTLNNPLENRKNQVAKKAAEFVENGDTIFINTSSTALLILKYIKNKKVNVITNNANAVFISKDPNIHIFLTGGELREPKEAMVGEFAYNNLLKVTANKAFIGCSGFSCDLGMTTTVLDEVRINELMINQCTGQRYVLAEGTKIGNNSNFVSSSLDKINVLITDETANIEQCTGLTDAGIRVIKAK